MNKKLKIFLLSSIMCAITLTSVFASLEIGAAAPDFTLPDSKGTTHSLSQHAGSYVVLEWTNPACPFVRKHYDSGNMQQLQKAASEKGVVWLSIASSAGGKQGNYTAAEWNEILETQKAAPTALLLDPEGKAGKLYDAKTTPHMYVINPEGKLIYQGAIDSLSGFDPAEIPNAINYVQQALDQAMAGETVSEPQTAAYGCSVKY